VVLRPVPKWGGFLIALPTVASLVAWALDFGLWAAGIALVSAVILLAWAGYRLQKQLDSIKAAQAKRDHLGRLLMLGQHTLLSIESAATLDWSLDQINAAPGDPMWDEATKTADKARHETSRWEELVERHLQGAYGPSHVARFRSQSGLPDTPMDYDFFSDRWKVMWRRMHCRFMRLDEFIKEIPRG